MSNKTWCCHVIIFILWFAQSVDGEEINCKGKEPGYHADIESDCRKYLLCTSSSANTRGLHFNCPPGTKFHQATQVCHHESAVDCSNTKKETKKLAQKKSQFVKKSKKKNLLSNNFEQEIALVNNNLPQKKHQRNDSANKHIEKEITLVENKQKLIERTKHKNKVLKNENVVLKRKETFLGNFLDNSLDDSIRLKREKWTDLLKITTEKPTKTAKTIKPLKHTNVIKTVKSDLNVVNPSFNLKKHAKKPTSKKKNISIKKSDEKLHVENEKEVIEPVKLEQHDDIIYNCTGDIICKSPKLRKKEIRENLKSPKSSNKEERSEKPKLVKVTKSSDNEEDETRVFNGFNVKTSKPSLLIPKNLVDDNIKLSKDSARPKLTQKPIKFDSDKIQNTSRQNADEPISNNSKTRKNGAQNNISFRTKPLDKLPFTRVIAAQRKNDGAFSPYIPFPELLANLTKSSRSVRMIPIAISSNEAKYIRKLLQIQHKGSRIKQNPDNDHLRHPRKINKSDTKVISPSINGIDITKEYQIVYKEATTTTTVKPEVTTSRTKNEIEANAHALIRPRGPPRGFFNREKFQQILTSNLRSDKDQNQVSTTTQISLEFGFNPIRSGTKTPSKKKDIYFSKNDVYFDEYLDTLQAPTNVKSQLASQFNSIQNSKRSPKYFSSPKISSPVSDAKLDRKSNLDFLGVFDTRKYFFIPPNRRSDAGDGQDYGIFTKLVKIFQK